MSVYDILYHKFPMLWHDAMMQVGDNGNCDGWYYLELLGIIVMNLVNFYWIPYYKCNCFHTKKNKLTIITITVTSWPDVMTSQLHYKLSLAVSHDIEDLKVVSHIFHIAPQHGIILLSCVRLPVMS